MKSHSSPVVSFPESPMTGTEAQPMGFEPLLNTEEAAALLQISRKTLERWARAGRVPAFNLGRWRFRASQLDAWLRDSVQSGSAKPAA
jgi:excisionase family DNA binding protein